MKIFNQTIPATEWVITHDSPSMPVVNVSVMYDGVMQTILPVSIEAVDNVTIKITFSQARTGTAVVRSGGV